VKGDAAQDLRLRAGAQREHGPAGSGRRCSVLVSRWINRTLPGMVLAAGTAFAHDPAPVGNAGIGRGLYNGSVVFEKGGPPCGACHAIGGQGPAMNASFGPDLSKSDAALDGDVLDGVLTDQPYKSMKPLYAGRPISAAERAHLAAFFQEVGGKVTAAGGCWFGFQAALFAAALGALLAWGRRRRPSPREELQKNARRIEGDLR
jgi:mono/diheme cytochrome c family protein